jgi:hypothetical protein
VTTVLTNLIHSINQRNPCQEPGFNCWQPAILDAPNRPFSCAYAVVTLHVFPADIAGCGDLYASEKGFVCHSYRLAHYSTHWEEWISLGFPLIVWLCHTNMVHWRTADGAGLGIGVGDYALGIAILQMNFAALSGDFPKDKSFWPETVTHVSGDL